MFQQQFCCAKERDGLCVRACEGVSVCACVLVCPIERERGIISAVLSSSPVPARACVCACENVCESVCVRWKESTSVSPHTVPEKGMSREPFSKSP